MVFLVVQCIGKCRVFEVTFDERTLKGAAEKGRLRSSASLNKLLEAEAGCEHCRLAATSASKKGLPPAVTQSGHGMGWFVCASKPAVAAQRSPPPRPPRTPGSTGSTRSGPCAGCSTWPCPGCCPGTSPSPPSAGTPPTLFLLRSFPTPIRGVFTTPVGTPLTFSVSKSFHQN